MYVYVYIHIQMTGAFPAKNLLCSSFGSSFAADFAAAALGIAASYCWDDGGPQKGRPRKLLALRGPFLRPSWLQHPLSQMPAAHDNEVIS